MPRCPSLLRISCLAALVSSAGCREAAPWDAAGWRPEQPPQRIVAASILAAEVLLEIAPRERIAGVHTLAADPKFSLIAQQAADMPLVAAEPEALLAVRPDLVIADAFTKSETQALLRAAGVPMLRTIDARSFDDVAANIRSIGRVCHLEDGAEKLVQRMTAALSAVQAGAADCSGWRLCSLDGALHTYGRGSLFDAVVKAAGAENVAATHGAGPFRKLDLETVLSWRPDALVVGVGSGDEAGTRAWLDQAPGLRLLPCVEHERLLLLPGPLLGTTSHRLVEAAALVQQTLRRWGRP